MCCVCLCANIEVEDMTRLIEAMINKLINRIISNIQFIDRMTIAYGRVCVYNSRKVIIDLKKMTQHLKAIKFGVL